MPRENWTDNRLDEFKEEVGYGVARLETKVDDGFVQVDKKFEKVEAQFEKVDARFEKVEGKIESGLRELRGKMNQRFEKVDLRFEEMNGHLLALHRLLIRVSIGGAVAFAAALVGLLAR